MTLIKKTGLICLMLVACMETALGASYKYSTNTSDNKSNSSASKNSDSNSSKESEKTSSSNNTKNTVVANSNDDKSNSTSSKNSENTSSKESEKTSTTSNSKDEDASKVSYDDKNTNSDKESFNSGIAKDKSYDDESLIHISKPHISDHDIKDVTPSSPVPEPGSLALMGLGILLMVGIINKRRIKS